jgi:Phosphoglycerate dehydrogenase and related dehydrogenases
MINRLLICIYFLVLSSLTASLSFESLSLHFTRRAFSTVSSSTLIGLTTSTTSTSTLSSSNGEEQYWNRETSSRKQYQDSKPISQMANIICLSDPHDDANQRLYHGNLPKGAQVIAVGSEIDHFDIGKLKEANANVIFVSHPKSREPLAKLIQQVPSIQWIHSRSAGIDFITSNELSNCGAMVTNAKGCFSSTLAEYTMMAISFFAKDLPRLLKQKHSKTWEKYCVEEIRGKTLGIIGYGDIGRAAGTLAKAYGMKVIALRRNPQNSQGDPICDEVYSNDKTSLCRLVSKSDYILCAAPLTPETRGLIDEKVFSSAKKNSVFINVGRGPIVEEDALIEALKNGPLKGAALDVVATEPLPKDSELWTLENVLLSPHNMDMTETFMHEATEFFIEENLPRFLRNDPLLNLVDKVAGY